MAAASGPRDLLEAMNAHDAAVIAATDSGRAGDWDAALASLKEAATPLVTVRTVREVANAQGADTSTLDDLLSRLEEYDAALTELYTGLRDIRRCDHQRIAGGRGPGDRRPGEPARAQDAMVVVMSDLAGPPSRPCCCASRPRGAPWRPPSRRNRRRRGGWPDDSSTSVGADGDKRPPHASRRSLSCRGVRHHDAATA